MYSGPGYTQKDLILKQGILKYWIRFVLAQIVHLVVFWFQFNNSTFDQMRTIFGWLYVVVMLSFFLFFNFLSHYSYFDVMFRSLLKWTNIYTHWIIIIIELSDQNNCRKQKNVKTNPKSSWGETYFWQRIGQKVNKLMLEKGGI